MAETFQRPSLLAVLGAFGRVTFLEILRDRILYNVVVVAALLFLLSMLASKLWSTLPERVLLDFGIAALSMTGSLLGIILGSVQLSREIERRTIYMALSRPISRLEFISGKYLGLVYLLTVNWALISSVFLALLYFMVRGTDTVVFTTTLLAALVFALLQSWVLTALAVLFSTISTASLSVVMALGVFSVGVNISELRLAIAKFPDGALKSLANFGVSLLPNLEHFNLGLRMTYQLPVGAGEFLIAVLYAAGLIGAALAAAGLAIRLKEI